MISPKRSLGQNFLRDENVARNIVHSLQLKRDDFVLEIGPGTGSLTKHLVGNVDTLVAVEIDPRAVQTLAERFGTDVHILKEDVLRVSLPEIAGAYGGNIRIVGNIPYYITSDILFWMFDQRAVVRDATIMLQLEVARRLTAVPRTKDYGILSVMTALYSVPQLLFKVSRNSFFPRPTVDSAVVHLAVRTDVQRHHEALLRNIVRATFGKRRKTLFNGLKYMGFRESTLRSLAFDLQKRPEELAVDDFLRLTELLEPHKAEVPELKFGS